MISVLSFMLSEPLKDQPLNKITKTVQPEKFIFTGKKIIHNKSDQFP